MSAGRRWPGFFGSFIDGVVQRYWGHYAEELKGRLVIVLGGTKEGAGLFAKHNRLG